MAMNNGLKAVIKHLFVGLGFFFLFLGIVGTIMPVMPTMPFLFFAYLCFRYGSEKFKKWYINSKFHKYFISQINKFMNLSMAKKALYFMGMVIFLTAVFSLWYFILPKLYYMFRELFPSFTIVG